MATKILFHKFKPIHIKQTHIRNLQTGNNRQGHEGQGDERIHALGNTHTAGQLRHPVQRFGNLRRVLTAHKPRNIQGEGTVHPFTLRQGITAASFLQPAYSSLHAGSIRTHHNQVMTVVSHSGGSRSVLNSIAADKSLANIAGGMMPFQNGNIGQTHPTHKPFG